MPPIDSKRYKALQARRAELLKESRALLAKDVPTDEEKARKTAILDPEAGEIAAVDTELAQFEALFEAERRAPSIEGPITVTPRSEADPMRGFANAADFALSVRAACHPGARSSGLDERLKALYQPPTGPQAAPSNYHQEGHSSEGYMVPPAVRQEIWSIALGDDDLFGMVNPEPTSSNSWEMLADESTPWGATGIQAYWRAEGSQMTASRLATEPRTGKLHELYALVLATGELLQDAPRLNARLVGGAGRAIQWKASEAIVRGTGAGQPLGYETAPCLVSVAKESGQAADTIVAKNLLKMFSRRLNVPGSRWVWLANSDIVPQLVDLKIGNEPSWVAQNQGLAQAPTGMMLSSPIRFTEHAKTVGDQGDIALVDISGYYATVHSSGVKFDSSIHLYFDYNVEAFRWIFRLGGAPFLSAPVSPANGSNTKSSFIVLDARA